MKGLTKAIGGAGLTISGAILWFLIFAGLDFRRVSEYGLFHEIGLKSVYPVLIFLFASLIIILGIVFIFSGIFDAIREDETYNM